MQKSKPKFCVGQLIHHKKFDYHGVVLGVDPEFNNTEEWYEIMAQSRPPKDQPWYHVLPDDSTHMTYVAERHLEADPEPQRVEHPLLHRFFDRFHEGRYRNVRQWS